MGNIRYSKESFVHGVLFCRKLGTSGCSLPLVVWKVHFWNQKHIWPDSSKRSGLSVQHDRNSSLVRIQKMVLDRWTGGWKWIGPLELFWRPQWANCTFLRLVHWLHFKMDFCGFLHADDIPFLLHVLRETFNLQRVQRRNNVQQMHSCSTKFEPLLSIFWLGRENGFWWRVQAEIQQHRVGDGLLLCCQLWI